MPDDYEERFRQYEAMLQGLARIWEQQHTMNQDQQVLNQRLTLAIERIDRTLEHVQLTQASMERLLQRLFPPSENGRDA